MILDLTSRQATDLFLLLKPRVALLVLLTTAVGLYLAPQPPPLAMTLITLLGTALLVGASNVLNMYLERESDALMNRTKNRPLPAKRLGHSLALWFGILLAVLSTGLLIWQVNLLTAGLGLAAFLIYLFCYTPLKQKSHVALLIGAIPGAIPPLMGWTAATGSITPPGLALFFILFLWQIPHFLAIALLFKEDYQKAGIRVFPLEKGEQATKYQMIRYLVGLTAISFYPTWLGIAGQVYFWTALTLGIAFLVTGLFGLKRDSGLLWARTLFLVSIVYLPILLIALLVR